MPKKFWERGERPEASSASQSMRCTAGLSALLVACSPTLDWREFSPEGVGLQVTFPCRAERYARRVELAGSISRMELLSCEAGGAHYSVAFTDIADPTRVSLTLAEWRRSTSRNVQGRAQDSAPFLVKGMAANEEAVRVRLAGRLPNGQAVAEEVVYFVQGLRLYQAAVTGAALSSEAVDPFFSGLRFPLQAAPH